MDSDELYDLELSVQGVFPMGWVVFVRELTGWIRRLMQLLRVPTRSTPSKFTRNYGEMSWRMFTRYTIVAILIAISADSTPRSTNELGMYGSNTTRLRARVDEGMIPHVFLDEYLR